MSYTQFEPHIEIGQIYTMATSWDIKDDRDYFVNLMEKSIVTLIHFKRTGRDSCEVKFLCNGKILFRDSIFIKYLNQLKLIEDEND